MREITVSPEEFEEGLNRTHYGLQKPKEMVCDFFSNLIWRCRQIDDLDSDVSPGRKVETEIRAARRGVRNGQET